MTGFSSEWLSLREPFDREARGVAAQSLKLPALGARLRGADPRSTLSVLDLACGTGANLRELAPRLGGSQQWTLVDHDPRLLEELPVVLAAWTRPNGFVFRAEATCMHIEGPGWNAKVQPQCIDLALEFDTVPLAGQRLVTASALLDLVSASWLDALFARVSAAGAAMLFALNVDGRVAWDPPVAGDEEVNRLFALHQHRDKGFGLALGAEAAGFVVGRLQVMSYDVARAASDWCINAIEDAQALVMLAAMVEGMGAAAIEQDPTARSSVNDWMQGRSRVLGKTRLRIGHQEIVAA
ncbi:class I SAM-dependent methyltransferase [Variovorax sp. J22R24]|uniref:class I SAM-dependent methyltransferase n=1 Tax=Variovorax gracilis TaxID=3053502 RepID=UPI0025759147|nr:class I SAM-dependent methyltransferase [Variovorax sp. J22R24]MDM0104501.1 class I SAM-dependent methyltransferase [Variovorax sp. J22R24]